MVRWSAFFGAAILLAAEQAAGQLAEESWRRLAFCTCAMGVEMETCALPSRM